MQGTEPETEYGPWNPGIESTIPPEFAPLATLYRPENSVTDLTGLRELSDFSGIAMEELVVFRPERLAVHELLIRVIADLSVPDGAKYEDLGKNFRAMTSAILSKHILPRMEEIKELHGDLRRRISQLIGQELQEGFAPPSPVPAQKSGLFARLGVGGNPKPPAAPAVTPEERDIRIVSGWGEKAAAAQDGLERSTYQALVRVATAIRKKYGRLIGGPDLLAKLAVAFAANEHGSEAIGRHIEPYFLEALREEGYKLLPFQTHPLIMNVKGASASGKSTLRPMQKQLAKRLGISWEEIALISPDIWRKFLLDYGSLGPARRYAGALTGQEVAIIDKKLDRHMMHKGENGRLPHLAIDRFRFDSFATDKYGCGAFIERFGHLIYVFFMITPPEATVERAWKRGERFGRYKAVDDLLYHNVEAYTGIPKLFFTWNGSGGKPVHFEFLDNSVPKGTPPRTVAFGTRSELNILDVKRLIDVDRFKKINISARRPEDVYVAGLLAPEKNIDFLRKCARTVPSINFADQTTGRIYAKVSGGRLIMEEEEPSDPEVKAGLAAIAAEFFRHARGAPEELGALIPGQAPTLGAWGGQHQVSSQTPAHPQAQAAE
jgi:hypothetical protein